MSDHNIIIIETYSHPNVHRNEYYSSYYLPPDSDLIKIKTDAVLDAMRHFADEDLPDNLSAEIYNYMVLFYTKTVSSLDIAIRTCDEDGVVLPESTCSLLQKTDEFDDLEGSYDLLISLVRSNGVDEMFFTNVLDRRQKHWFRFYKKDLSEDRSRLLSMSKEALVDLIFKTRYDIK